MSSPPLCRSPSAGTPSRCRCGCTADARLPVVPVRLRLGRQRLGHEADLDERLHLAFEVGVDDAIDDRPVVDRLAVRVLGVGVGRSPLQRRRAVARRQQVVRADVDRHRAELGEFGQQLLAVLHVGVVRLVVAEPRPHGLHRRDPLSGVDLDDDALGLLRRAPECANGRCRAQTTYEDCETERAQPAVRHSRTSTGLPLNVTGFPAV